MGHLGAGRRGPDGLRLVDHDKQYDHGDRHAPLTCAEGRKGPDASVGFGAGIEIAIGDAGSDRRPDDADSLHGGEHQSDRHGVEPARGQPHRKQRQVPADDGEKSRINKRQPARKGVVNDCRCRVCH